MAKIKRGQKMVCAPCGREVTISACGVSNTTIWCCGRPMKKKGKAKLRKRVLRKKRR